MPTKTDRILSNLPLTYQTRPPAPTLRAVVDPFGIELQKGENSLAAVLQSHWVDFADLGANQILDLAKIGALYGLGPREDELVEEFREHLKRYIRTFLEGTVTVQGLMRITAESLGLHIADDYADIDTWWTRANDSVLRSEPDGRDAAYHLFGTRAASNQGQSARAASIQGSVDLSKTVDCSQHSILRLEVDNVGPFEIDLAVAAKEPTAVSGEEIVSAINTAFSGQEIATFDGRYLTLTSPQRNAQSILEVQDVIDDAAEVVLGLPPRAYYGRNAQAASVRGAVDLSGVLDLSSARYLRLLLDGEHLAEIDCAGPDPSHTLLDQVVEKINAALGIEDAVVHDGSFLTLKSPSTGLGSSIVFQRAAAQQALLGLFGPINKTHIGRATEPARVVGRRDLSQGVDLSERANIQLRVDGGASIKIDCSGEDAENTQLPELVAIINEALSSQIASHDGQHIILTSTTTGSGSEILFQTPTDGDATELIFGIGPRIFHGQNATAARLIGTADLTNGANLLSQYILRLVVDGRSPIDINMRPENGALINVALRDMADQIDTAVGADVAATDGQHLILVSPTLGSGSSLSIQPLEIRQRERFVSRAFITDEAAQAIFGFHQHSATGQDATNARVLGQKDLQRGVDLQNNRYLRLVVDNFDPVDIDCAGPRPRATLLQEIRANINNTLQAVLGINTKIASDNGRRLILSSQTTGSSSRIAFEPPRIPDALDLLLGIAPGEFRGHDAEQVIFVGTADLSQGVDLSSGDRIKIGIDGEDVVEIACAANALDPSTVKLNEMMIAINLALGRNLSSHDGKFLKITSPSIGTNSQLVFEKPETGDATTTIFGITAPRSYKGVDAAQAEVIGIKDLSQPSDLRVIRFLRLSVDGAAPIDVDCVRAGLVDVTAVTLDDIIAAINAALNLPIASADGPFLKLVSPTNGQASRLTIEPHSSGDARELLFGSVATINHGQDAQPATIVGDVDLLVPADLSKRSQLRLAVDEGLPQDVDVVGITPQATFLNEIVTAINQDFSGLASATENSRLLLTSPTSGSQSRLQLLPLRTLDVVEYPPQIVQTGPHSVRHRDSWQHDNNGAAAATAVISILAPQGTSGPAVVNKTLGWQLRLMIALGVAESAHIWAEHGKLHAEVRSPHGAVRPIAGSQILVGPLGTQTWVPFDGTWQLSGDAEGPPSMQLNNPWAEHIVQLHARQAIAAGQAVKVKVTEADIVPTAFDAVAQDGQMLVIDGRIRAITIDKQTSYTLVDASEHILAHLRAGDGVNLANYTERVGRVRGTIHPDENEPLLIVQEFMALFNVQLTYTPADGDVQIDTYTAVTIGHDPAADAALTRQIQQRPSPFVGATALPKADVLTLPQGRSNWRYLDCYGARFDYTDFDAAVFPGDICLDRGVFDVSRFVNSPPEPIRAVFAGQNPATEPPVLVTFQAQRYQPGVLRVHLPADLPVRFGARCNQSRFGQGNDKPELYIQAVTEPEKDPNHIKTLLNAHSSLVEAVIVPRVPLGWEPIPMPFRTPVYLQNGDEKIEAQLYLSDPGIDGFLKIYANELGAWGNQIAIAARESGPAMVDFSVIYAGDPFENGRLTVAGKSLAKLTAESMAPGPIGILQAKAAGVNATVTRERTPEINYL